MTDDKTKLEEKSLINEDNKYLDNYFKILEMMLKLLFQK